MEVVIEVDRDDHDRVLVGPALEGATVGKSFVAGNEGVFDALHEIAGVGAALMGTAAHRVALFSWPARRHGDVEEDSVGVGQQCAAETNFVAEGPVP